MKLFNYKYFRENIKKSKGLIAFVLGLVPLLNIVMLTICITEKQNLMNFNLLSIITQIGLYFIPIILAFVLFGFVFKRRSVDFVMAQPISRKSLYFTNILGGFFILLIFMLFNVFIFLFFNLFFSTITIPFLMIVDYFVLWLVSYIFMFSVAVLAITLAGNLMGSIVLILIIICLYPFLVASNLWFANNTHNYIKCTMDTCAPKNYSCDSEECATRLLNNEYYLSYNRGFNVILTAPILILEMDEASIYNVSSLIKMVILSIIYLSLGYYQFKNRKMENNETSFKSEFAHYFVKTITLIPVTFILMLIIQGGDFMGFLVSLVLVFIYYNIYDLITRKEIFKFLKSVIVCYTTFLVILGAYYLVPRFINKEMVIEDITSISLEHFGNGYNETLVIKDKDMINILLRESLAYYERMDYDRRFVTLASKNKDYAANLILSPTSEDIIEKYCLEQQKEKRLNYKYQNILYVEGIPVTKELKNLIKETMQDVEYKEDYKNSDYLKVYNYTNHDYEVLLVPYMANDKLFKYVEEYENNMFLEMISKNGNNLNFYLAGNVEAFGELDEYVFNYVIKSNLNDFADFIKTNNHKKSQNSAIIQVYNDYSRIFHIYDVDAFKKEFVRYQEKLSNDETYLELVENFKDSEYEY